MNGRLLLVDDEPAILRSLQRLFRHEQYEINTATSGADALLILEKSPVDLIISDMRMPHMSGAEFLAQARSRFPDTVRILLTGYSDMESTVSAINNGGIFGYLTKPWDAQQLKTLVSQALQDRNLRSRQKRVLVSLKKDQEKLKQCVERQAREMSTSEQYVSEVYKTLQDSYGMCEETLLNMLELRSPGERQCASLVDSVAQQIARQVCLSESDCSLLHSAAYLHAIGKVALPEVLLSIPVRDMTQAQLSNYYQYPAHSAEILVSFPRYCDVSRILLLQKAYLDGTGSPMVNDRHAVPLMARVLMLAVDYADAILGRLTGQALLHEGVIQEMEADASRYDASLLAALSTITMEVSDVSESYDILLPVQSLFDGMSLKKDLHSRQGALLLRSGVRLDQNLITQLCRLQKNIKEKLILNVSLAPVGEDLVVGRQAS